MKFSRLLARTAAALTVMLLVHAPLSDAQESGQPELAVVGVDITRHSEIPVPKNVTDKANLVYEKHRNAFSAPPPIDTRYDGRINIFYIKRTTSNATAAAAGNLLPYNPSGLDTDSPQGRICLGESPRREKWCSDSHYSVKLNADRMAEWSTPILLSHEFIHLRQYQNIPGSKNRGAPFWLVDGQANGIGFGLMEREKGFGRRAMALHTKDMENSNFSFFLGLRYYDRPLDVDRWKSIFPVNHPEYGLEGNKDRSNDHVEMAGYMTGSFWRHVMRGRPKGFNAFQQMLFRAGPDDPTSSLQWLRWTDSGLKAATFNEARIWRGGVRQVYSEMIAELADFPDIVARNRTGKLRADYFDSLLWSEGCQKVDLMVEGAASVRLKIFPYSARCLRIRMPSGGFKEKNLVESGTPGLLGSNLPPPFNVTAVGTGRCKDLALGTRGQLLGSPLVFNPSRTGNAASSCAAMWEAAFAPLNISDPNGLQGWQTVVLINAPDSPRDGMEATEFTLNFVRPTAKTRLSGSHTVKRGDRKTKKPLPDAGGRDETQISQPVMREIDPGEPCDADGAAIFKCGDVMGFSIATGKDATGIARMADILTKGTKLHYPAGEFTRDGFDSLGTIYANADFAAQAQAASLRMASGEIDGMMIGVAMPRLEEGQTGSFPATVYAGDDLSETGLNSLSGARTRSDGTGCRQILSYATNGTVNITANGMGMLAGSLSATLYEDNPDDEAACTAPRVRAGEVTVSFATPGFVSIGPNGKYALDFARAEEDALAQQDIVLQMMTPMEERSDILPEDEMRPETRAQLAAYRTSGGAASSAATGGQCKGSAISPDDSEQFMRAVAAGSGADDPATINQVLGALRQMGGAILAPYICQWIEAGRPARFELGED